MRVKRQQRKRERIERVRERNMYKIYIRIYDVVSCTPFPPLRAPSSAVMQIQPCGIGKKAYCQKTVAKGARAASSGTVCGEWQSVCRQGNGGGGGEGK